MAITYHPLLPSVSKIVHKYHKVMIEQSQPLAKIFAKPSLVAYRRSKNIGDILVKAKVYSKRRSTRTKNGFSHCKRVCILCGLSEKTNIHKCNRTGQVWKIKSPINSVTAMGGRVIQVDPHLFSLFSTNWVVLGEDSLNG